MYDLSGKVDEWTKRRKQVGRERTLPVWIVPQGFDDHGEEFWWRVPTGDEVAVQIVLGFNHGVLGHCAWNAAGATTDIFTVSVYPESPTSMILSTVYITRTLRG